MSILIQASDDGVPVVGVSILKIVQLISEEEHLVNRVKDRFIEVIIIIVLISFIPLVVFGISDVLAFIQEVAGLILLVVVDNTSLTGVVDHNVIIFLLLFSNLEALLAEVHNGIHEVLSPLSDDRLGDVWVTNQRREAQNKSLHLKVFIHRGQVFEDVTKDLLESTVFFEALNGGALLVPQIHHNALNKHVLEMSRLAILHSLEVEPIDLMDNLAHALTQVLKTSHDQGDTSHGKVLIL